jgi:polar amino acid transport system substrate-binding protein
MKFYFWVAAFFWSQFAFSTEQVELATHYDHPPFVVDMKKHEGLVFELADYLTKRSLGKYDFQVTYVPNARLQTYLNKGQKVVIPFVAKEWFTCRPPGNCLWTDILMMDRNVIVTQASENFEYAGPNSLHGKIIGTVVGRLNPDIEDFVKQGIITTSESPTQVGNFKKLVEGRIDVLVTGEIIAKDIIARENWQTQLAISKEPLSVVERRILVSPATEQDLYKWLNDEVKNMEKLGFYSGRSLPSSPNESRRLPASEKKSKKKGPLTKSFFNSTSRTLVKN